MPHDLFGDVVARPRAVRSRRSPLVVVSLAAHGTMLVGLVVASIAAPGALPFPKEVIAAYNPRAVQLVDIPLPKEPRPPRVRETDRVSSEIPTRELVPTTPLTPPDGVTPETGTEGWGAGDGPVEPKPSDMSTVQGSRVLEPPPPAGPAAPVRLHAGMRAPRKVAHMAPAYPALAQQLRIAGVVMLEATIDAAGVVQSARVLRSVPLLDQAAIDAVLLWRYEPARLNDQPVAVIMTVTVNFTLGR